jgi:hypothetical protein
VSRRYGRNQKRQARATEEDLRAQLTQAATEIRKARSENGELRGELRQVAEALGPNFIGLTPRIMTMRMEDLMGRREIRMPRPFSTAVESLPVMDARAQESPMDGRMHIQVRLAGGEVAYAISRGALRDTPVGPLTEAISRALAVRLLQLLGRGRA